MGSILVYVSGNFERSVYEWVPIFRAHVYECGGFGNVGPNIRTPSYPLPSEIESTGMMAADHRVQFVHSCSHLTFDSFILVTELLRPDL